MIAISFAVLHPLYLSESNPHSMEAFAKKKGKVGTRGGGQIIKENDESLIFYRFVLFPKICDSQNPSPVVKCFKCLSFRNMILGANGLYFLTMAVMGRSYAAFDIAMFIISAISYIGCFQFMR